MAKKPAKAAEADAPAMLALIETPNLPEPTPVDQARIVLLDAKQFDQFYDKVKGQTDAHVADVSTPEGREAVRSLAFRVTKTATTLDKSALELTKVWRDQVTAVNAARMPMVERLKTLASDVRKPLTDWETAEATRIAANRAVIDDIRTSATVTADDTAEATEARGRRIWAIDFAEPQWTPEEVVEAVEAKKATVAALVAATKRLKQEEADRAELARLRAAEAERLERERVEAEVRRAAEELDRIERERLEADAEAERQRIAQEEQAERDRLAAEQAERDRIKAAEEAAEQRAREQAEREREAERARVQAEHDALIAAEREARERVEREAREAEEARRLEAAQREADEKRQREAAERERQRIADEQAEAQRVEDARKANAEHRRLTIAEAVSDIEAAFPGINPDMARDIVNAIASGQVRHCEVKF